MRKLARKFALAAGAIPVVGLLLSYGVGILNEGTPFGRNHWTYFPFLISVSPFLKILTVIPEPLCSSKSIAVHLVMPILAGCFSTFYYCLVYFPVMFLGSLFAFEKGSFKDEGPKN